MESRDGSGGTDTAAPVRRPVGTRDGSWRERRALGRAVRVAAAVTPLAAAVFVPWALAPHLSDQLRLGALGTLAVLVVVAAVVHAATERLCRRLLPLSMLLGLSLGFPGSAPSRLRTALGTLSLRDAQRLALDPSQDRSAAEAASDLVRLAAALRRHDQLTRGHVERVGAYADLIAVELGLGREDRGRLRWAALLHDIGKLAVPAAVLNKTSALTDAEWEQVKTHPAAGDELIRPLKEWLGIWGNAVVEHHERMDGRGYPAGLSGADISLGARIVAVADAFDVMTSHRSYQTAVSPRVARQRLVDSAGTQFDEDVVRAFLSVSTYKQAWVMGPVSLAAQLPLLGRLGPWSTAVRAAPGFAPLPATVATAAAVGLFSAALLEPAPAPDPTIAAVAPVVGEASDLAPVSPPTVGPDATPNPAENRAGESPTEQGPVVPPPAEPPELQVNLELPEVPEVPELPGVTSPPTLPTLPSTLMPPLTVPTLPALPPIPEPGSALDQLGLGGVGSLLERGPG